MQTATISSPAKKALKLLTEDNINIWWVICQFRKQVRGSDNKHAGLQKDQPTKHVRALKGKASIYDPGKATWTMSKINFLQLAGIFGRTSLVSVKESSNVLMLLLYLCFKIFYNWYRNCLEIAPYTPQNLWFCLLRLDFFTWTITCFAGNEATFFKVFYFVRNSGLLSFCYLSCFLNTFIIIL